MNQVPRVNMLNMGCGVFTYSSPAYGVDPLKVTWLLENFDTRLRRISFDLKGKSLIFPLFFRNGRCLEIFGKREHTVILQEVEISS